MGPTPRTVAADAIRRLEAAADPAAARQAATYFKPGNEFVAYGVRAPRVRAIAREVHAAVRSSWDVGAAMACCEVLSTRPQHEAKAVGVLLLGRYHRSFPPGLLRTVRRWIAEGRFANWAAVDLVCPEVLTPLVERRSTVAGQVRRWSRARLIWLRRASVVTFVPLARAGRHLDDAYAVVFDLRGDQGDLIHKACGWLLREAGKTDPHRLERFLLDQGPCLPRTTVRYAIERFPPARRRTLLSETRP